MTALKVLCVHGVGNHHTSDEWKDEWSAAIRTGLGYWTPQPEFELEFVEYDALFEAAPLGFLGTTEALMKLGASGLVHGLSDLFHRSRGFGNFSSSLRWTAGMVVQWAENDELRRKLRALVLAKLKEHQPDLVLAHSLGSLVSYDAFGRKAGSKALAGRRFATFGSQIGNPFVRSTFGGRIRPLAAAKWHHLYNPHDDAFAAEISLSSSNFEQVTTEFDVAGVLDHDAIEYLKHPNTVAELWSEIAAEHFPRSRGLAPMARNLGKAKRAARLGQDRREPRRRALLVGINEYPDPASHLEGCVNDVFLMSSLLQERGFEPEDIRIVLDERATAQGIRERLAWLLDKPLERDQLVLFYSGHGAQMPGYGRNEQVDRHDECLVPWDFDWTRQRALIDDDFYELYSQLPYGTRLLTILDCCHSGGMAREGGRRVRGLNPPDDIRHRALRWDARLGMWKERELSEQGRAIGATQRRAFAGESGSVRRLGRASPLRGQTDKRAFDRTAEEFDHWGPYMPVIFEACQEHEEAMEYRHGVTSYGAFTYALSQVLRESGRKRALSFEGAVKEAGRRLKALGYAQQPQAVGPRRILRAEIPWFRGAGERR